MKLVDLLNLRLPAKNQLKPRQKRIFAEMVVAFNEGKALNSKAFRDELAKRLSAIIPRKNPYAVKDVQRYLDAYVKTEWFQRRGQVYNVPRIFDFRTDERDEFPKSAPKERTILLTIKNLRIENEEEE